MYLILTLWLSQLVWNFSLSTMNDNNESKNLLASGRSGSCAMELVSGRMLNL
jgi:hypothetical protein